MKIRISKVFLNSKFDIPITLKYISGLYEPVMLTFRNHPTKGPEVIISSPEHKNNASIFLYESIKFTGFGPPTYTEDFIFNLYYNESKGFLIPEDGEVRFQNIPPSTSYKLPPIRLNGPTMIGYFNEEDKDKHIDTTPELEALKKHFQTY